MKLLGKILNIQDNLIICDNNKWCKSFVGEKLFFNSKLGSGIIFNLKIFLLKGKRDTLSIGIGA